MLRITMAVTILVTLMFIFELLRRKALREKYAFVWIVTALILIVGSLFPEFAIKIHYYAVKFGTRKSRRSKSKTRRRACTT